MSRLSLSLLLPSLGFLFCLIVGSQSASSLCVGEGCTVYSQVSFLGISLYYYGAAFFALLLLIRQYKPQFYIFLSVLGLAANIPFLLWQTIFLPCSNCLLVSGLLLVNTVIAVTEWTPGQAVPNPPKVFLASVSTLLIVAALNLSSFFMRPWTLGEEGEGQALLFFSPSCEACQPHIENLPKGVALVPVGTGATDHLRIVATLQAIKSGMSVKDAVLHAHENELPSAPSFWANVLLQFRLFWNQNLLLRSGGDTLPWYRGYPDVEKPTCGPVGMCEGEKNAK